MSECSSALIVSTFLKLTENLSLKQGFAVPAYTQGGFSPALWVNVFVLSLPQALNPFSVTAVGKSSPELTRSRCIA